MPYNNTGRPSFSSRLKTVGREASEEVRCGFAPATTIRSDRFVYRGNPEELQITRRGKTPRTGRCFLLTKRGRIHSSKVCQRLVERSSNCSLWYAVAERTTIS